MPVDPREALASLIRIASGPKPPPRHRTIHERLIEADEDLRWRILFALVLDLTRKLSYVYESTKDIAIEIAPSRSPGSMIDNAANEALDHEASLRGIETDPAWERPIDGHFQLLIDELIGTLVEIVDLEKTTSRSEERTKILEVLAGRRPPSDLPD